MVTVAILGANGFIGSRLVEFLHLNNLATVRPVVRRFESLAALSRFDLDSRVARATDEKELRSALVGCDVVVHAIVGPPNVITGTLTSPYKAAQAAGVRRLIYLSSASVHGQAPSPGTNESSPLDQRQLLPYNNAKVQAESKLQELRNHGDVEVVLLRPGIVYGPRSSWVTGFADSLMQGTAYLMNRGHGICNSIYVDNLVHAIVCALSAPDLDRQAFLLRDAESVTWADLYSPIATALGYNIDDLPEAETPEAETPTAHWKESAKSMHKSKPVQAFLSLFPQTLRQSAYNAVIAATTTPISPWSLPSPNRPVATLEMALLYGCNYKLPYDKAQKVMGYQPIVSFQEAIDRTIGWLDFAGYPINRQSSTVAAQMSRNHGL